MDKMTVLIAIVAVGLALCFFSLLRIEHYLHQCLLKLIDLDSTADNLETLVGQVSAAVDKD